MINTANFLKELDADTYYPKPLVDKAKAILTTLCADIDARKPEDETQQVILIDEAIKKFNRLAEDFEDADSELETVAREAILSDIQTIMNHYNFTCDFSDATGDRDW